MNIFQLLLLLAVSSALLADDKCSICKNSVKAIKEGKGLAYMANLTTKQIEEYVKKNVQKNCSGASVCPKLIKDLIDIADQLDDDMNLTPEQVCKFQYYC